MHPKTTSGGDSGYNETAVSMHPKTTSASLGQCEFSCAETAVSSVSYPWIPHIGQFEPWRIQLRFLVKLGGGAELRGLTGDCKAGQPMRYTDSGQKSIPIVPSMDRTRSTRFRKSVASEA